MKNSHKQHGPIPETKSYKSLLTYQRSLYT